jgi:hypothetical protein
VEDLAITDKVRVFLLDSMQKVASEKESHPPSLITPDNFSPTLSANRQPSDSQNNHYRKLSSKINPVRDIQLGASNTKEY